MRPWSNATIRDCAACQWLSAGPRARCRGGGELRGSEVRRALGHAVRDCGALCPGLVFVQPRFDVYKEVSAQIREIFLGLYPLGGAAVARRGLPRRHPDRRQLRSCDRHGAGHPCPDPGADGPDGVRWNLLQQVPREAGLGSSQAERADSRSRRRWDPTLSSTWRSDDFTASVPLPRQRCTRSASAPAPTCVNHRSFLTQHFGKAGAHLLQDCLGHRRAAGGPRPAAQVSGL